MKRQRPTSWVSDKHNGPRAPRRAQRYLVIPTDGSTSIAAAIYDRSQKSLRVRFRPGKGHSRGGTYDYLDVPVAVIREFLGFDSKGRFVNWFIKPHFACRPVRGAWQPAVAG